MLSLTRRGLLVAGAFTLAATVRPVRAQGARPRIAALFAGRVDDKGFMQAGYAGLTRAAERLGVEIAFTQGIKPDKDLLAAALRDLAKAKPDLVVAHGGQNNAAAAMVAAEFPDIRFAVTQGNVKGPNLASYEVLQEQSAFLAGALAALVTKTGTVGHMSGIRVTPGLKGRAAYAAGVAHVKPEVKLLTNFSGNQDDNPLSKKVATAMIEAGADVIFTMLNAGRTGAIEACRARGAAQIGNVQDWVAREPDVFVASAIADSGLAMFDAAEDVAKGTFQGDIVHQIGLEDPDAVRLTLSARVPGEVAARIAALAADIVAKRLEVPTTYSGPEFATPA